VAFAERIVLPEERVRQEVAVPDQVPPVSVNV